MTAAEHTSRLAELCAAHKAASGRMAELRAERDRAVRAALSAGVTQRAAAEAMGVSHQLVGQIALRREPGRPR